METALLALVLIVGLYMAWCIGANDVSNAMGTSVGSKALTLTQAVIIAAVLEFSGSYFFGAHVSETVQKGIVNPDVFKLTPMLYVYGMIGSLIAAAVWLHIATFQGWPVSTTHTIIGAVVGFGAVAGGVDAIYWENVTHIALSWIASPLLGGAISFTIFSILRRQIFYSSNPVHAAKKLSPLFIFIVLTTLSFVLLLKGLKNIDRELSVLDTWMISLTVGLLGAGVSYILLQRVKSSPDPIQHYAALNSRVLHSLAKAKKHLERAKAGASGQLYEEMSDTLAEVERITHAATPQASEVASSEYHVVEKIFGYLQILTACLMAFAHGANDVANAIGPLSAAVGILQNGFMAVKSTTPDWILAMGGCGIVLGLATWGWRVIETIGKKITELTPTRGFSAEFGAALTIVFATGMGMPISTTHTLVGAVLGVGLARGIGALNLNTIRDIVLSWIVTLPAGAILSVLFYHVLKAIFGG